MLFWVVFLDFPFSPNVRISSDPDRVLNQGESSFAVYQNRIYTICNTAERSIYPAAPFAYSEDRGETWTDYNFVDNTTGIIWHTDPVVCTDTNGDIHLFLQFSLYYIKHYLSVDGGKTWIDTSMVSDTSTHGAVDKPWFVMKKGVIYGVWQEFGGESPGIRFAISTDRGKTFKVSTIIPYMGGICGIDVDEDGIIYVVSNSGGRLWFFKSEDNGETWISQERIGRVYYRDGVGDRASVPSLSVYGKGNLYVVWTDIRYGTWDILGMYSTDGGETWSGVQVLGEPQEGGECKPWITFDPYGGVHLFYYKTEDYPTNLESKWSVRYRYAPKIDSPFHPSIRITDTTFSFYYFNDETFMGDYHTIRADSYYVYAVWTDGREGDMDLFFSKAKIKDAQGVKEEITQNCYPPMVKVLNSFPKLYIQTFEDNIKFLIADPSGRIIDKGILNNPGHHTIKIPSPGCFFLVFEKGEKVTKIKQVVLP